MVIIQMTGEQLSSLISDAVKLAIKDNIPQEEATDKLLTVREAARFLGLSVPTIYDKVHKGEIPVSKRARRLFFSQNDLTEWVKAGKRKTNEELAREAIARAAKIKKRG